jgi:hypothetical protein
MPPRERPAVKNVGRADHDLPGAAEAARNPGASGDDLAKAGADDRGGSRDGERLDPGDPGDREQYDNDGGRKPMK